VNIRTSISLRILAVIALLSVAAYMSAQVARTTPDLVPTGKGWGEAVDHSNGNNGNTGNSNPNKPGNQCTNGICYHGGPVMGGTIPIYYIWYGNWSGNSAVTLLPTLVSDLSASGYEHINTTYSITNGTQISGAMALAGTGSDSYSQGTALTDANIKQIVTTYIAGGVPDSKGIYFVLTSADVNETSGFCTQYCGWHTHGTINNVDVKYSFVGNPARCLSACAWQSTSPNGNAGADGMASIIAHESEEAISDPDLNAWYDRQGAENADKCAWTFGTTSTINGAVYNFTGTSGTNWLIQRNWLNANGGLCTMSY
jgi:hypothetical protein